MKQRVPITRVRLRFIRDFRVQNRGVLGQDGVRQGGAFMMDSMKRLVQERKGGQSPRPTICDDASGGAVHGGSSQTDVLDVFAPALEIGGQKSGKEVHPNE